MSTRKWKKLEKLRIFWEKYERRVVLAIGFISVAVISFEVGVLQGNKLDQKTLVIEKVPTEIALASAKVQEASVLGVESKKDSKVESTASTGECLFVGSKNSNKYHKPDCRWAKNIKAENLVCFKNEEEAKNKGYVGDKGCIK
ncbi:MAG TPA: hypothetical protein DDY52_01535 [Candidatus Moranbacteria bacterium]|nr:hypothetical protein [Candidatus Moranbacteria bacterium]